MSNYPAFEFLTGIRARYTIYMCIVHTHIYIHNGMLVLTREEMLTHNMDESWRYVGKINQSQKDR